MGSTDNVLKLRWYQADAEEAMYISITDGKNSLLQAPTRSGKSIILASLIRRLLEKAGMKKIIIMIESELLVEQLYKTMVYHSGLDERHIGICCGSHNRKDADKVLIIGTRQTIVGMCGDFGKVDMLFIDEAHLVGRRAPVTHDEDNDAGENVYKQYFRIIDMLKIANHEMNISGCTATPWGLKYGYIYGDRGVGEAVWAGLTYKIRYDSLYADGSLVPITGKIKSGVYLPPDSMRRSDGEFNIAEVSAKRLKYNNIIVDIVANDCAMHDNIVIFCIDIANAEDVAKKLCSAGISASSYHSNRNDCKEVLDKYKSGTFRVLVSVEKPAIGFDHHATSCVIMMRDTGSSALFLQMMCRGMTPCAGKNEFLFIDLTDNSRRHLRRLPNNSGFDLDSPIVLIPAPKKKRAEKDDSLKNKCRTKTCLGLTTNAYKCPLCGKIVSYYEYMHIIDERLTLDQPICPRCNAELNYTEVDLFLPDRLAENRGVTCNAVIPAATKKCPYCATSFSHDVEVSGVALKEVSFCRSGSGHVNSDRLDADNVYEVHAMRIFSTKKEGVIGVSFTCIRKNDMVRENITDFICIPPWYKGAFANLGLKKWKSLVTSGGADDYDENRSGSGSSHRKNMWLARNLFAKPCMLIADKGKSGWNVKSYIW